MLRPCSREEFDQNLDLAWTLARDLSRSGYPTYCDGIKTREMFVERALKAFARDTEEILLFEADGAVQGWIHYYCLPEDRYLGTVSFLIARGMEQALEEFLAFAESQFPGDDLFLGFPAENRAAVTWLGAHGFDCIEEDWNNTAFPEQLEPTPPGENIVRIGRENYELFRSLHERIEGEMYWNSDRILADLDRWTVFVRLRGGEPEGAVYFIDLGKGWYEIFGVDTKEEPCDPAVFRSLLEAALYDVKQRGAHYMTLFSEEETEALVREAGFACVGKYLCFQKQLESR